MNSIKKENSEWANMTPLSFPSSLKDSSNKSVPNLKEDQEFKIKITKALENLWRDEQSRRDQLKLTESMKFFISYKNNLEYHTNDPDFLPHNQIYINEKFLDMKEHFKPSYKDTQNIQAIKGDEKDEKIYSKCFYSNFLYQNFLSFMQNEKVFMRNIKINSL